MGIDLTTFTPGDWTVAAVLAFVVVFGLLRLVQPRPRLETTRHTIWNGEYITPSHPCGGCQHLIHTVNWRDGRVPVCPRCDEPLPVLDWIDDTHIEVLL